MTHCTESALEETALKWLKDMGYTIVFGNAITPENMLASLRGGLVPAEGDEGGSEGLIAQGDKSWTVI